MYQTSIDRRRIPTADRRGHANPIPSSPTVRSAIRTAKAARSTRRLMSVPTWSFSRPRSNALPKSPNAFDRCNVLPFRHQGVRRIDEMPASGFLARSGPEDSSKPNESSPGRADQPRISRGSGPLRSPRPARMRCRLPGWWRTSGRRGRWRCRSRAPRARRRAAEPTRGARSGRSRSRCRLREPG